MKTRLLVQRAAFAFVVTTLAGCAEFAPLHEESRIEQHFGEAVREAVVKQTLNPNAGTNTNPVRGMDGVAARETIKTYQKSFKQPESQPGVFTIEVGGIAK